MTRDTRRILDVEHPFCGHTFGSVNPVRDRVLANPKEGGQSHLSPSAFDGGLQSGDSCHIDPYITVLDTSASTQGDIKIKHPKRMPAAAETSALWQRFEEACLEAKPQKKIDQQTLAGKIKASQSTISNWKRGQKKPPIGRGIALADYAGICVEFLYTGKGPRTPWGDMSRPLAILVEAWEELDPAERDKLLEYAQLLRLRHNQPENAAVENVTPIRKSLPPNPT